MASLTSHLLTYELFETAVHVWRGGVILKRGLFFIVGTLMVLVLGIATNPFIGSHVADGQVGTDTATDASFAFGLEVAGVYVAVDETMSNVQIFADGNMIVYELDTDGQIASVRQGIWQTLGPDSLTADGVLVNGTGEQTEVTLDFAENLESVTVSLPNGTVLLEADRVTIGTDTETETETETETDTGTETETETETDTGTETGTDTGTQ
jgi:hypothetical protein